MGRITTELPDESGETLYEVLALLELRRMAEADEYPAARGEMRRLAAERLSAVVQFHSFDRTAAPAGSVLS